MHYHTYTLENGIRLIHLPGTSPVAYSGFAVNVGARDEQDDEHGMAHFIEHLLFKGTEKRRSWHILNRMEAVGGELNAYTTKEETFIYSIFPKQHFERAFELLSDLVFHSRLPEQEAKKELEVIVDEIQSYEDNPSELIYDDFENLLFEGHRLGHHILGTPQSLGQFTLPQSFAFMRRHYRPDNIVFFSSGDIPFKKIIRLAEKYTGRIERFSYSSQRIAPACNVAKRLRVTKETSQAHVMIGSRAYSLHDDKRLGLYLLNNILGGPGMNSRLNISLREKHALVYQVDSSVTSYSDTGVFSIYFGSEKRQMERCLRLVFKELKKLCENKLTASQLDAAKKQLKGQLGVSAENRENNFLNMGKSFLHYNRYDSLSEIYAGIDALDSGLLWDISNETFDEKGISCLVME
ncbi:MAG: insulinase family protein [Dysgonamonadaceae bacterium]|jgi:predicted Zn-dependent peptidase|nr:insulinase family protein [Dysgonamonadaceae bacterium]